jgi:plasmid replication initiation protein
MQPHHQDLTVAKSNRLVEAAYRLTLVEQRIILLASTLARKTKNGLNPIDFVTISAKDYLEFYGNEHHVYEQLKEAAQTLYERGFTLYDKNPATGNPMVVTGRWVSSIAYTDKDGMLGIKFSPDVIPYLTALEREFTRYQLEKIAKMTSPYAIRLYELLMQWESVGEREVEVIWLKKVLMIEDEYSRFTNLKARVIDPAVSQINTHTDHNTSYLQRKTGRNVTHFIFTYALKEESKPAIEQPVTAKPTTKPKAKAKSPATAQPRKASLALSPETHPAFSLAKVAIPAKLQVKYLTIRSPDEIILCLQRANDYGEQQQKAGKRVSYGALYRTALEDGWHVEQAQKNEAEEEKVRKKKEAAEQRRIAAEEKARAEHAAAQSKAQRAAIMASFRTLPEGEQTRVINEFLEINQEARDIYQRRGPTSQFFIVPFVNFLLGSKVLPAL